MRKFNLLQNDVTGEYTLVFYLFDLHCAYTADHACAA